METVYNYSITNTPTGKLTSNFCGKNVYTYSFNAKEMDEEAGFYYYSARYYDPMLGIFLSVDPHADRYPWISSYSYCKNNPLNRIDPTGMDDYKVDKQGNISRLKDQSRAIEGKDRLIAGRPKFDKEGNLKNKNIIVDEGTFQTRKEGQNTGIDREYNLSHQNKDGSIMNYNSTAIHMGGNEGKAVDVFEFLTANTNVEWSLLGGQFGNKNEFSLTTSHKRGIEPFGTIFGDILGASKNLSYHIHNHRKNFNPSPGDMDFRERNAGSGAIFGIYIPGRGYKDYNGNSIQIPRRK